MVSGTKSDLFRRNRSIILNMKISLEALQVLDAIDTRGSFSAAAAALHRVPSALTHTVRKLEDDLALTLFVRQGRRAMLTPAGRVLLEDGRRLLAAAGDLECRVRRVATGWETELRIAVAAIIPNPLLFPLLQAFYAENGDTRLRLLTEVLNGSWDALTTGRADLSIGASGDVPPGGGFRTLTLGDVGFAFVVAPGHPLADVPEPLTREQILRHRAVAAADTSRELVARSSGLLSGQDVLTVPDVETKVEAHVAGLGVGYLPRWRAEKEAAAGRLRIKSVAEDRPPVPLLAAWRADHEGRALAWFVERMGDPLLKARLLGAR
jgi:DNA-binding transcriptional LysR family regulator